MAFSRGMYAVLSIYFLLTSVSAIGQSPMETVSLAWDPTERWIATTSYDDNIVRIWNAATGLVERSVKIAIPAEYTDNPRVIDDIEWSPDGTELAYLIRGRDNSLIQIIDAESLDVRATLNKRGALLNVMVDIEWSPDGAFITGANNNGRGSAGDYNVYVWDTVTGELVHDLLVYDAELVQVAWNPAPATHELAFRGGLLAAIWNVETNGVIELTGHDGAIYSLSWNNDGTAIVTLDGESLRLWNPLTGAMLEETSIGFGVYRKLQRIPRSERFLAVDYSDILTITQIDGIRDPELNMSLGTDPYDLSVFDVNASGDQIAMSRVADSITIIDLSGNSIPFATPEPTEMPTAVPTPASASP